VERQQRRSRLPGGTSKGQRQSSKRSHGRQTVGAVSLDARPTHAMTSVAASRKVGRGKRSEAPSERALRVDRRNPQHPRA
jgi:hypothetical protein